MDGVLADFEKKFQEFFGHPSKINGKYPKDWWEHWKLFVENDLFEFLEPFPKSNQLLTFINDELVDKHNVVVQILSASGGAFSHERVRRQKLAWLYKHNIWYKPNIVANKHQKRAFASENSILIDDNVGNCEQFTESGGTSIIHTDGTVTINKLQEFIDKNRF